MRGALPFLLFILGPGCTSPDSDQDATPTSHADTSTHGTTDTDSRADTDPARAPLVIWTVRHAEKDDGDDPSLTDEGVERSLALVDVMQQVPLTAVYATDLKRTQETVQPTATDHGLEVVVDIDPEEALAAHVVAEHMGEQILHGGHSYTIPDFFDALGVAEEEPVSGYGQIWIVSITPGGRVSMEMSHFGE